VEVQFHVFLASALNIGEWPASRPGRFIYEKRRMCEAIPPFPCVYVYMTSCLVKHRGQLHLCRCVIRWYSVMLNTVLSCEVY
jgi:hypothetical protein